MPIKWVLHWQQNAITRVNAQILTEISQCVESIHGVKEVRWKNTLSFYKPMLKDQANASEFPSDFSGISLQEQPNKYYMLIRSQRLIVEAESSILTIMENLQSYKTRVALNFEIEYLPISSWETSHQIMGEFFNTWKVALEKRSLPGYFVLIDPKFSEFGLSDQYTSQHTAVQYSNIMAQMIATAQSSSRAARN
ncbi:unnamed protein product [Withania somnifera]